MEDGKRRHLMQSYGVIALASVIFDIGKGHELECLYPTQAPFVSEDAKKDIAHLALPHSNNQEEGDTQYVVRFRGDKTAMPQDFLQYEVILLKSPVFRSYVATRSLNRIRHDDIFLYGFVMFRRQRDASQLRGYSQRALVLITIRPYVILFERTLRVIGPIFFHVGPSVLEAIYTDMTKWSVE